VSTDPQIFVKSHISRDLLQNAALFKTDKLVVWEYVSNGLQYVDPGTNPVVNVTVDSKKRRLSVADNGRGMDWTGLQNFFVMHGENLDRKTGRPGRGRFGTGKSAAFGIGDVLRVRSVRNGRRSSVELTRDDLTLMQSGDPIPVHAIEQEVQTTQQNGTLIEIDRIHLRTIDQAGIIRYIERHLAHWPKNCTVYVNNHECEFFEPAIADERTFLPTEMQRELIGDTRLIVKVAKGPVEEDLRGISIFSNGVWHETTMAGAEGKELANYIFGDIDVPRLEEDTSPISPFDLSRSMRLNPSNDTVRAVYAFIYECIEQVRRTLIEAERKEKASEDARRLAQQANEIARFINDDFDAFRQKVAKVRAKSAGTVDMVEALGKISHDGVASLVHGDEQPAEIACPTGAVGSNGDGKSSGGTVPRTLLPDVTPASSGDNRGREARRESGSPPRGGFSVQFKSMGVEERRASYAADERTIYINLDHPQLVAARGDGNIEEITFRRLAYEVAFTEYAIALTSELAERGEYIDPSDPIFEIRETINRLARRSATLYSN
jgi:hypothetical protein